MTGRKHSTYYRRCSVEKEKHDHCCVKGRHFEKKAGKLNKNDNLGHHLVSRGAKKMYYKTQNGPKKKKNKLPPGLGWRPLHGFFTSQSLTKPHGDIPVHINNRRQVIIEENMFTHLEQGISSCPVHEEQDATDLSRANQFNVSKVKIPSTP